MFYLVFIIFILPVLLFLPTKVVGKRNIRKMKTNFILTCNHTSNWDVIIMQANLPKRYFVLAKKQLFKNKLFGAYLRSLNAIPVDRGNNDIESVKEVLRRLKKGKNLLIFPQGTRVKQNEYMEIKNGTAMFALKTHTPIIPCMFVKNTKIFTRNVLLVGEPYNLSEMPKFKDKKIDKDLLNEASDIIVDKMMELKENYMGGNGRAK